MLLKIAIDKDSILYNQNGTIIINIPDGNLFSFYRKDDVERLAAWICTVKGNTLEDFENNDIQYEHSIFVDKKGRISF